VIQDNKLKTFFKRQIDEKFLKRMTVNGYLNKGLSHSYITFKTIYM